ncbi:kelch-like protein 30 isoform X2 [Eublepharis macularius]|uniref:Kelch-like protein 30 isoform X2 n=1 Tax=Eublepharis macularius TaxID=481883 RepID=A0AA97JJ24_EUBMA|nr:kelch-like protein 30 isoform X2 [Eublepharis macularius]
MVRNIDDFNFSLPSHPQSILEGLQALRSNPKLSDVTLIVGGHEFPCHRSMLALCSHYFNAMFAGDFLESFSARVEIQDVDPVIMESLIDFAYTGKVTINQGNVEALIRTSNQLHFPIIRKVCSRYLRQQMDATNCLGICEFGEMHGCPEVSSKAWSFLQENFELVSQQEEFLELSKERLVIYLSNNLLQVQEEQSLVEAVLRWVKYEKTARAMHLPELLDLVHLVTLPDQYLQNLLSTEPLIQESDACKTIITKHRSTVENRPFVQQRLKALPQKLEEVLVVVGGRALEENEEEDGEAQPPPISRNFAFFNTKTKEWIALPDFPDYNKWGFSMIALNNKVYITGGSRGSQNDTWSTTQSWCFCFKKGAWKPIAPMLKPRTNHATAVLNGEIYAIGGTTVDIVEVECYDPYNDSWCFVSPALKYVSNFAIAGCLGKLYLIGSCAVKYNALTLQCYNPAIDVWSVIASPFIPKYLSAPCCVALHGVIYLIGDNTKKVYVYDPDANIWQKVQQLHTLHENGGMVSLGGKLFVTGGHWKGMDGDYRVEMEIYDCAKDIWTREGSLPCLWLYHSSSSIFIDTSKWRELFLGNQV